MTIGVFGTHHFKEGVSADPDKVAARKTWPTPKNLKQLRGFLGLTGYYRRFIKGYGEIKRPLTKLLKKEAFFWSEESTIAFEQLKTTMINAPVLALLDYSLPFMLKTDASGVGVGAMLMQQGRPLAFISKGLSPKHHGFSTYEKELLAIIPAKQKWYAYLQGHHFIIRMDHQSLTHLLE